MVVWLNRAIFQLPRDGTAVSTVTPSSATGLVDGAAFTPTAGRLLVVVMGAAVTSTGTSGGGGTTAPAGWSGGAASAGYNAVNHMGLYLFHKTATGGDTLTAYHNAANYPVLAAVYEFPAGSTVAGSVAAVGVARAGGANPNLTGLSGAHTVMAVKTFPETGAYTGSYTWSGAGTPVEDWDLRAAGSPTDGYQATLAYVDAFTGTSWQPTAAWSGSGPDVTAEALTFAITVAAGDFIGGTLNASTPAVSAGAPSSAWSGVVGEPGPAVSGELAATTPTVTAGPPTSGWVGQSHAPVVFIAVPTVAWSGAVTGLVFAGVVSADVPAVSVYPATSAWAGSVTVPSFTGTIVTGTPLVTVAPATVVWAGAALPPPYMGDVTATTPTVDVASPTTGWVGTVTAPSGAVLVTTTPGVAVAAPGASWAGTSTIPAYSGGVDAVTPPVTVTAPTAAWSGVVSAPGAFTGTITADVPLVEVWVSTVAWTGAALAPTVGMLATTIPTVRASAPVAAWAGYSGGAVPPLPPYGPLHGVGLDRTLAGHVPERTLEGIIP